MLKNNMRMTLLLSALIGLVLASFATVPPVNAVANTPLSHVSKLNFPGVAGYVANTSSGVITYATSEWNQPAVTCQPGLPKDQAVSAGLLIRNSSTLFFLDTAGDCAKGSLSATYAAFIVCSENSKSCIPGKGRLLLSLTVNPGDTFSASFTISPTTQVLTASITDVSTGQSASATADPSSLPALAGFVPTAVGWGIETALSMNLLLSQFNVPIRFSNCSATVSGQTLTISKIGTLVQYTMVDLKGNTLATTSHLSKHGSSFQVTWVSST
jgi:hypothetical protein